MIKANDLRVGNVIKFNNHLEKEKIVQVNLRFFASWAGGRSPDEMKIDEQISNYYSGIPLTPEILEKCGFKYGKVDGVSSFNDDSEREGDTHYWDLSIKRNDLIDSHEITITKWGEQEYFTFQLGRGTYRQQIKYVHQLQNLVYPLAGVELEVTW
jgi:hypothetical protein